MEDIAIRTTFYVCRFLASHSKEAHHTPIVSIGIALSAVVGLIVAGKWLMNPLFRLISKARIREMMTGCALLVVLGAALAMEIGGLSMAMGAFVAGVMMSESAFAISLKRI